MDEHYARLQRLVEKEPADSELRQEFYRYVLRSGVLLRDSWSQIQDWLRIGHYDEANSAGQMAFADPQIIYASWVIEDVNGIRDFLYIAVLVDALYIGMAGSEPYKMIIHYMGCDTKDPGHFNFKSLTQHVIGADADLEEEIGITIEATPENRIVLVDNLIIGEAGE